MSRKKGKKFNDEDLRHEVKATLDDLGREIPDPKPMAVKVMRHESDRDRIRRMIREEMSIAAEAGGMESFEEADDFDIEDPWDTYHTSESKYELVDEEYPIELGAPDPDPQVADDAPGDSDDPPADPPEQPDPEVKE